MGQRRDVVLGPRVVRASGASRAIAWGMLGGLIFGGLGLWTLGWAPVESQDAARGASDTPAARGEPVQPGSELVVEVLVPRLIELADRMEREAVDVREAIDRLEAGESVDSVVAELGERSPAFRMRRDQWGGRRDGARRAESPFGGSRPDRRWSNPGDPGAPPREGPVEVSPERLREFFDTYLSDTIPEDARPQIDNDRFWAALADGPRGQRLAELIETMDRDPELGRARVDEFRATLDVARAMGVVRRALANESADPGGVASAQAALRDAIGRQFDALSGVRELEIIRLAQRLADMQNRLDADAGVRDEVIERHTAERIDRLRSFNARRTPRD